MPWYCPKCKVYLNEDEVEYDAEYEAYVCSRFGCSSCLEFTNRDISDDIYLEVNDDTFYSQQQLQLKSYAMQQQALQQPTYRDPFSSQGQDICRNSQPAVVPPPPPQQQQIPPNNQLSVPFFASAREITDTDFYSKRQKADSRQPQRQNQSQKAQNPPQRFHQSQEEDLRRSGRKRRRDSSLPDKKAGGRNTKKRMLNQQPSVSYGSLHATHPPIPTSSVNGDVSPGNRSPQQQSQKRQTTPQQREQSPPHRQPPLQRQSRYPKRNQRSATHTILPPPLTKRGDLRRNRPQQQTKVTHPYTCNHFTEGFGECSKKFPKKFLLEQHRERHTTTPFQCDICGGYYPNESRLNGHKTIKHKITAPPQEYPCNHYTAGFARCSKVFPKKFLLEEHRKRHTTTPFQCDICGEYYPNESRLKGHKTTKHKITAPPQEYPCNHYTAGFGECSKKFQNKSHFKGHEKRHIPTSFQCDICGEYYPDESRLNGHKIIKHKITAPPQEYPCNHFTEGFGECSKKFPKKFLLEQHRERHTTTPFQCDICGEYYSRVADVKAHKTRDGH